MSLTEGKYAGEFLLSEVPDGKISRDTVTVTVPATTTLDPGQVLGKITSTGKYVPVNNDATPASDGSQVAAGILYAALVNDGVSPVDMDGVVIDRDAEVRADDLEWGASDPVDGEAELFAIGIKLRS